MRKSKILYTSEIKDHGSDLSVYGVFCTKKVHWDYYVISHNRNKDKLTAELCRFTQTMDIENVTKEGKKFNTKEEGILFVEEYKDKWEYASNDTRQEKRDQKIDDILE